MEQLISTPVTPLEIMLGKLTPYFVIGMFDVVVCAADRHLLVPGSLPGLVSDSVRQFGACSWWLCSRSGFFISVIAKSQLAASQIALLATFLPAFLLSGFSVFD